MISDLLQNSTSANEKVIQITHDKVCRLIGHNHENIRLIEKICEIKISIPPRTKKKEDEDMINITLTANAGNLKKFDDLEWTQYVIRYLRSATRGGFVKKMTITEYHELADLKRASILDENAITVLEGKYNVEVTYINFKDLVYVCVVERKGMPHRSGDLEKAIKLLGDFVHSRYRGGPPIWIKHRSELKDGTSSRSDRLHAKNHPRGRIFK